MSARCPCPKPLASRVIGTLSILFALSCNVPPRSEPPSLPLQPETPSASNSATLDAHDPPDPVAPDPPFASLSVTGYGNAIVSVPSGARRALPVLVAAHGAGDRPTWQCEVWREIVQDRGFVLCPQGTRMGWGQNLGFFFRHHHALEKEVLAALEALHARFGDRIAPGPVVYAGYSQGGSMGALMVVKHPHLFQRLILVEGGEGEWDVPTATRFRQGGGQRVLLVCGRHPCAERARKSLGWLQKGGVDARLEHVPGGGHSYGGSVAERLLASFDWIVEGDPRWLPP